jgi:mannose-6-phosphate isomerase
MAYNGKMDTYREERPWGRFEQFTHNEASTVKLIQVQAGGRLSLQRHRKRDEFWRVIAGSPRITIEGRVTDAREGDEFTIPKGRRPSHRIS